MANKTGLKYYTVDTDRYMDIRIKRLRKDFGCRGVAVYDYILCEIYRDKGCFLVWGESTVFDVAEYYGLKECVVTEIVEYCGVVGLFDRGLLARGIITSESIQRRYLDMCNRAKRSGAKIPEEYRLIPEKTAKLPEKTAKLPEKTAILTENSGSFSQSKVNKRKISPDGDTKKPPLAPSNEKERYSSLTALAEEAAKSQIWLDAMAKNLQMSPSDVEGLIRSDFVAHCLREGKWHTSLSELQSHFNRWASRQKYTSTQNVTTTTANPTGSRRPTGGLAARMPVQPECGIIRRPNSEGKK